MPDFYFEVLINERSFTDQDLQRAEHVIQYARGDALPNWASLIMFPLGQSRKR